MFTPPLWSERSGYDLNICILPKFTCGHIITKMIVIKGEVFERWLSYKPLWIGLVPIWKTQEEASEILFTFYIVRTHRRHSFWGMGPRQTLNLLVSLFQDSQLLDLWMIDLCCIDKLLSLRYFIVQDWMDWNLRYIFKWTITMSWLTFVSYFNILDWFSSWWHCWGPETCIIEKDCYASKYYIYLTFRKNNTIAIICMQE